MRKVLAPLFSYFDPEPIYLGLLETGWSGKLYQGTFLKKWGHFFR